MCKNLLLVDICSLSRILRLYHQNKTHYDVLKVNPNSTTKEIKESFLKLSKQNHPDTKGPTSDAANTAEYIKILEAYRILSKKSTRDLYDLDLEAKRMSFYNEQQTGNQYSRHQYYTTVRKDNLGRYYGIKGVDKVSNLKVAVGLLLFAIIGSIVQFFFIRNSVTLNRERLAEQSKEAGLQHANVRADAEKYGNKRQLERIAERILHK